MKRTSGMIFTLVLVLSLVLIMAGPMATPVQATEKVTEPESGGDADNDDSIGTQSWGSRSKVSEQDNDSAVALLWDSHNTSYYLKVTDFGFDIPDTADIKGIKVEVDRHATPETATVLDNSICLVKDESIVGANRSEGAAWPQSESDLYESYGGSTDLWVSSWDPGDINNSGFGVAISAVLHSSPAANAWVDHVRITVYYSVDEYYLTMEADPGLGGTAIDVTNSWPYLPDEEVTIMAVRAEGYWFDGWTADPPEASAGLDDADAAGTVFTMPAYDVTLTAHFTDDPPDEALPTVITTPAKAITSNGAELTCNYTLGDWITVDLRYSYRVAGTNDWEYTPWRPRVEGDPSSLRQGGLLEDTTYDFEAWVRYDSAMDPGGVLQFTTQAGCFIATAAYGTAAAEEIDVLREFRDSVLLESTAGSLFVSLYYQLSPPVADFIAGNELLRTLVRELLIDPIVRVVEATGDVWRN